MVHRHLFLAFFRSGMMGYGGGPSTIPLVHKEVVEKYQFMTDDEFADTLALGNTLPGPIITKMAGYIGYRVAGVLGMLNAIAASIVPTILLMIVLLSVLASIKDEPWVAGMTAAVTPVVGVMLGVLAYDFFKKGKSGLGIKGSIWLVIFSVIMLQVVQIHPGILIVALLLMAFINPSTWKRKSQSTDGRSIGG